MCRGVEYAERVWEQKLNDFSSGKKVLKTVETIKFKVLLYAICIFQKVYAVYSLYNRVSWGIFENFCVKSNLTVCKVTCCCKLQKKSWEQVIVVLFNSKQLLTNHLAITQRN